MAFWAVRLSGWLVGESEVRATQVEVAPGQVQQQMSTVYIKRCRWARLQRCAEGWPGSERAPARAHACAWCAGPGAQGSAPGCPTGTWKPASVWAPV
jgi:hypothetical protein